MKLFSALGSEAVDILPAWLAHYSALGVTEFRIVLHGSAADRERIERSAQSWPVRIVETMEGSLTTEKKCSHLTKAVRECAGEWVLLADADEFLELPYRSLRRTIAMLEWMQADSLFAPLLQRMAMDGSFPEASSGESLARLFPLASSHLGDRMNAHPELGKYPLFYSKTDTVIDGGHHFPPNGRATDELAVRGVTHHFKWRASRLAGLDGEITAYLAAHGFRLPTEGAFSCSRAKLFEMDLLRRPSRVSLRRAMLLKALPHAPEQSAPALKNLLRALDVPAGEVQTDALLSRRLRICLTMCELPGMRGCGGAGTSMWALAELLAAAGHELTIFYVSGFDRQKPDERLYDRYRERGIQLVCEVPDADIDSGSLLAARSYHCYRWLAARQFDVIHFADSQGMANYSVRAKRQGLDFAQTKLCVTLHGCAEWGRGGNQSPLEAQNCGLDSLETESVRFADAVISPSVYMLDWWRAHAGPLSSKTLVLPNILRPSYRHPRAEHTVAKDLREAVFIGRLEERKGLVTFCDALDCLVLAGKLPADFRVTFLGQPQSIGSESSLAYLHRRARGWLFPWRVDGLLTMPQAVDYLRQPGCFAVIPSLADNYPNTVLECIGAAIPFISTLVGGIPEMIHPEDREGVLIAPNAESLAAKITTAVTEGLPLARPAFDFTEVDLRWLAWHGQIAANADSERAHEETACPDLTVCLTAEDSAVELERAVAALGRQTDRKFDLVTIIGGKIARDCSFETEMAERGGRIIRMPGAAHPEMMGAAAAQARGSHLLFLREHHVAEPELVKTFLRVVKITGADIVTCGVFREATIAVPTGGPPELAVLADLFGGPHFFIGKQLFNDLRGFDPAPALQRSECWHFFLRALAGGKRIEVIPRPLLRDTRNAAAAPRFPDALLKPFTEKIPAGCKPHALLAHRAVQEARAAAERPESVTAAPLRAYSTVRHNGLAPRFIDAQFGRGWFEDEGHRRWSGADASSCEILFDSRRNLHWIRFSAEVEILQPEDFLEVQLNGKVVLRSFAGGSLRLPPMRLFSGRNVLSFTAALPPKIPQPSDGRALSACFSEISVDLCNPHGSEPVEFVEWLARQQAALPAEASRCVKNAAHRKHGFEVYFGDGWHAGELTHRWSGAEGSRSTIDIISPAEGEVITWCGTLNPFHEGDRLNVTLNNEPLASVYQSGPIRLGPCRVKQGRNILEFTARFAPGQPPNRDRRALSYSFEDLEMVTSGPASVPPRISYFICSLPRSGSSLLGTALTESGAGWPEEFCSPGSPWLHMIGQSDPDFLRAFLGQKSRHGIFGMKIHWWQFDWLQKQIRAFQPPSHESTRCLLERYFVGLKFVRLTREDKVRQAISYHKADFSDVWVMPVNGPQVQPLKKASFDYRAIKSHLGVMEEAEHAWDQFLAAEEITPLRITYEELAAHYAETVQKVLQFLGLPPVPPDQLQKQALRRQADDETEDWVCRFHELDGWEHSH